MSTYEPRVDASTVEKQTFLIFNLVNPVSFDSIVFLVPT